MTIWQLLAVVALAASVAYPLAVAGGMAAPGFWAAIGSLSLAGGLGWLIAWRQGRFNDPSQFRDAIRGFALGSAFIFLSSLAISRFVRDKPLDAALWRAAGVTVVYLAAVFALAAR